MFDVQPTASRHRRIMYNFTLHYSVSASFHCLTENGRHLRQTVQEVSGHGKAVREEAGRSSRELEQTGRPGKRSVNLTLSSLLRVCAESGTWKVLE